ncbi:ABC transporter ATP-binding protein [Ruminococcus sp.]|uniref:ABC transporter ATP-binding protein n=1 Tax=Ruminococcus sp. TaxID=41978 RepID=UPI0025EC844F|nr:ABC transporter ATP-binding protein [Ruminococcus sp.]MBQ8966490.1 ABC transporter ATP-binding protein [Ruminococcus sp.]
MSEYENAIEIKGLTKRYDGFTLDKLSFNVPKGSIMGFIGQNGAGKSTTINTILNIVKPDEGEIKVMGLDHIKDENEIKRSIAAVFDELPFNEQLNANNLDFIFSDLFENWDRQTFFGYLDRFALPRKKKFGQFSKGMKMKLQIAAALSHGARLLIMDEATTGLDPVVRNEILDIFLEYLQDEDNSILMSSHITSDLEKIADSVTFIDKGKLLLTGYKDDILDSHAVLKCTKGDFAEIDKSDFISARLTDFGADVMVADRSAALKKYSGLTADKTTLEEIMLFYVNREKKEWR